MQRVSYIHIPKEDYTQLLSFLSDKFGGRITRYGNAFFLAKEGRQIAILSRDKENNEILVLPGKSVFTPQIIPLKEIISKSNIRKKGKRITVTKHLLYCPPCQSFFVDSTTLSKIPMTNHETKNEIHKTKFLLAFSYFTYVKQKPLWERKGWIPPHVLFNELLKTGKFTEKEALRLTNLRISAFKRGKRISIKEILTMKPEELFDDLDIELADAYEDVQEAKKVNISIPRPNYSTKEIPIVRDTPQQQSKLYSPFISWTIRLNKRIFTPEEKVRFAKVLGLTDNEIFGEIPKSYNESSISDLIQIPQESTEDKWYRKKKQKYQKKQTRNQQFRYQPLSDKKPNKSIRSVPIEGTPAEVLQSEPSEPELTVKEQPIEQKTFLQKFGVSEDNIVRNGNFIKATKEIFTPLGPKHISIFNRVFPNRPLQENEFDPETTQIAISIAKELNGTIAVTEEKNRGWKSLCVIADNYTIRVASKRL